MIKRNSSYKYSERKYNIPIIGHFNNKSIRFNSIMEASYIVDVSPYVIFEACIGKIKKARDIYFEYENGTDWIKYKASHIRQQRKYTKFMGFN